MSVADFHAVVAALEAGDAAPPPPGPPIERVAVLGGGPSARTCAATFLAREANVSLWSPFGNEMAQLRESGSISVRGDDLVGNYATDPDAASHITLAESLHDAVVDVDTIVIAGGPRRQRTLGALLGHVLSPEPRIVVTPGLTFGALDMRWALAATGAAPTNTIIELDGLPWLIGANGHTDVVIAGAITSSIATLPSSDIGPEATALGRFFPRLDARPTVVHSAMADVAGALEIPALAFGGRALIPDPDELLPGAVPIEVDSATAASEAHEAVTRQLASERRSTALKWGVRDLPQDDEWLGRRPSAPPEPGTPSRRRLVGLTAASLVPLSSAARVVDVATPVTDAVIELVQAAAGFDVRAAGRTLESMGLGRADLDDIRKAVSAATRST